MAQVTNPKYGPISRLFRELFILSCRSSSSLVRLAKLPHRTHATSNAKIVNFNNAISDKMLRVAKKDESYLNVTESGNRIYKEITARDFTAVIFVGYLKEMWNSIRLMCVKKSAILLVCRTFVPTYCSKNCLIFENRIWLWVNGTTRY